MCVESRIKHFSSSHPNRFQIWEPRTFHVHKSLKHIEISFIQQLTHKGRSPVLIQVVQYSMRPRLTHRSESWSWGSRRSWGSPGARLTLSAVSLCARDSLRSFLFLHILLFVHVSNIFPVLHSERLTFSPLGPASPGVPGKPGGPSGPCFEETVME